MRREEGTQGARNGHSADLSSLRTVPFASAMDLSHVPGPQECNTGTSAVIIQQQCGIYDSQQSRIPAATGSAGDVLFLANTDINKTTITHMQTCFVSGKQRHTQNRNYTHANMFCFWRTQTQTRPQTHANTRKVYRQTDTYKHKNANRRNSPVTDLTDL
jgi:hypothetical protein